MKAFRILLKNELKRKQEFLLSIFCERVFDFLVYMSIVF